jgi:hypothetical protein
MRKKKRPPVDLRHVNPYLETLREETDRRAGVMDAALIDELLGRVFRARLLEGQALERQLRASAFMPRRSGPDPSTLSR